MRSRRPEEIVLEAKLLAARGFQEVVLTGIHISSYGLDFPEERENRSEEEFYGTALRRLIAEVAAIPQIRRIRLGSLEPRIVTESFVRFMAECRKVCPHFHLSLQSGCAATLTRMNRRYTPEEYRRSCDLLRRSFEHPAITTDIIVGFPGETEEEFAETRRFLEELSLYETHIFKYSRRRGTRADAMPDQIPEPVKAVRSQVLQQLNEKNREEFRRWYTGREAEVLLEEETTAGDERFFLGNTREYVKLRIPAEGHTAGEVLTVTVDEAMLAEE